MRVTKTTSQRFWEKVDRRGASECWPWTGAHNPSGVGIFSFWGRLRPAPHWAWTEENGPLPDGLWVLHHCDNPPCVNPNHLFAGTPRDNVTDMDLKGRRVNAPARGAAHYMNLRPETRRKGQDVGNAKLTNAQAADIRRHLQNGRLPSDLAARFGVSYSTIHLIEIGKRYAVPEADWIEPEP